MDTDKNKVSPSPDSISQSVYDNAREALEKAFGKKLLDMTQTSSVSPSNIIKQKTNNIPDEEEIDELIEELEKEIVDDEISTCSVSVEKVPVVDINITTSKPSEKSLEKTKDLFRVVNEAMSKFPRYISYEGSVVLCVLISMGITMSKNISALPLSDRELIKSLTPTGNGYFEAKFDEYHDFILEFSDEKGNKHVLNFFNTIIHPNPGDKNSPVEEEKIVISSESKNRFQELAGIKSSQYESQERDGDVEKQYEPLPRKQLVAGRNAYEIRSDMLTMALDYIGERKSWSGYDTPEKVINVAREFYKFVENKK